MKVVTIEAKMIEFLVLRGFEIYEAESIMAHCKSGFNRKRFEWCIPESWSDDEEGIPDHRFCGIWTVVISAGRDYLKNTNPNHPCLNRLR